MSNQAERFGLVHNVRCNWLVDCLMYLQIQRLLFTSLTSQ